MHPSNAIPRRSAASGRAGFTMIEVLTVAAIMAMLMAMTIPTYSIIADSRQREQVSEMIAAQVMGARAHAVQFRVYTAVMVSTLTPGTGSNFCTSQRNGSVRLLQTSPVYTNDIFWNKCFFPVPDRAPVFIPTGIGFLSGTRPGGNNAPIVLNPQEELQAASTFFIVFGPDGVLRQDWEVRYIYYAAADLENDAAAIPNPNTGTPNPTGTRRDFFSNSAPAVRRASRYGRGAYTVYDMPKVTSVLGLDVQATTNAQNSMNAGQAGSFLNLFYPSPNWRSPSANDNQVIRRTFINPYTGLGVRTPIVSDGPSGTPYVDFDN
jgi:prepilin-type N-terminal cleavage/methylation domain-containing protein